MPSRIASRDSSFQPQLVRSVVLGTPKVVCVDISGGCRSASSMRAKMSGLRIVEAKGAMSLLIRSWAGEEGGT